MISRLRHRGPDHEGVWQSRNGEVALGHRRLAIIDLSSAGHQPMLDTTQQHCVVFNGEVYNFQELRDELQQCGHSFRSGSDTEVILCAYREWDLDCLAKLDGMFAFAIYDVTKRRIFLARDRAGEKPLFYSIRGSQLLFASEIKALLQDPTMPRRLHSDAFDVYLASGFTSGTQSILRDICKLPAGHALVFDVESTRSRVWRYWTLPEPAERMPDEASLLDELEMLLQRAVKRQLVADVPLGLLLSGGIDSSLITAMATRASSNVKTFTVRFPGFGCYDETDHARLIAQHFSTEHIEVDATFDTVDLLPVLARQFDEPIGDSSLVPTYVISRLVRSHCTVALGGDGGDELFGGYAHYPNMLRDYVRLRRIPRLLRHNIAEFARAVLPIGIKGRGWWSTLDADWRDGIALTPLFDVHTRRRLLSKQTGWKPTAEEHRSRRVAKHSDILERQLRTDFENYLAEDILVKVDRASMLTSLEVRSPLLDRSIIEFAFGKVPGSLKASPTTRKVLLKKLAQRILPPAFDRHRKQGFGLPIAEWLTTPRWRDYFRDVLVQRDSMFDAQVVDQLFARGPLRARANADRLFALVMFELWRREYGVSVH